MGGKEEEEEVVDKGNKVLIVDMLEGSVLPQGKSVKDLTEY